MVDADTCGHANCYYQCIANCTCSGKLSGNGMDIIHHSKGYASHQSTDDHYRHVGIKSTISMLMEFSRDIARPSPIQFTTNPPVASAANNSTISTN